MHGRLHCLHLFSLPLIERIHLCISSNNTTRINLNAFVRKKAWYVIDICNCCIMIGTGAFQACLSIFAINEFLIWFVYVSPASSTLSVAVWCSRNQSLFHVSRVDELCSKWTFLHQITLGQFIWNIFDSKFRSKDYLNKATKRSRNTKLLIIFKFTLLLLMNVVVNCKAKMIITFVWLLFIALCRFPWIVT